MCFAAFHYKYNGTFVLRVSGIPFFNNKVQICIGKGHSKSAACQWVPGRTLKGMSSLGGMDEGCQEQFCLGSINLTQHYHGMILRFLWSSVITQLLKGAWEMWISSSSSLWLSEEEAFLGKGVQTITHLHVWPQLLGWAPLPTKNVHKVLQNIGLLYLLLVKLHFAFLSNGNLQRLTVYSFGTDFTLCFFPLEVPGHSANWNTHLLWEIGQVTQGKTTQ